LGVPRTALEIAVYCYCHWPAAARRPNRSASARLKPRLVPPVAASKRLGSGSACVGGLPVRAVAPGAYPRPFAPAVGRRENCVSSFHFRCLVIVVCGGLRAKKSPVPLARTGLRDSRTTIRLAIASRRALPELRAQFVARGVGAACGTVAALAGAERAGNGHGRRSGRHGSASRRFHRHQRGLPSFTMAPRSARQDPARNAAAGTAERTGTGPFDSSAVAPGGMSSGRERLRRRHAAGTIGRMRRRGPHAHCEADATRAGIDARDGDGAERQVAGHEHGVRRSRCSK